MKAYRYTSLAMISFSIMVSSVVNGCKSTAKVSNSSMKEIDAEGNSKSGSAGDVNAADLDRDVKYFFDGVGDAGPEAIDQTVLAEREIAMDSGKGIEGSEDESLGLSAAVAEIKEIVNLGKELWKIVQDNEPVAEIKSDFANALPKGVNAMEMSGFSDLQHPGVRYLYANAFGIQIYKISLEPVFRFGGQYKGKGRYLNDVAVVPTQVDVFSGYHISVTSKVISVTNVGTDKDPIASLVVRLDVDISTVVMRSHRSYVMEFRGDQPGIL
jgi:hypothetical protein